MASMAIASSTSAVSSTSFLQPLSRKSLRANSVKFAPKCESSSKTIRATAEKESAHPSKTSVFLSSLVGAAAALSVAGSAFADLGPANDGAGRTAEKADELLQAADNLTTNESPPRFGPGRSAPDETSIAAQKAGSGVKEGLTGIQEQVGEAGSKVSEQVGQAGDKASELVGQAGQAGDKASGLVGQAKGTGSDVASKASEVTDTASEKASDVTQGTNFFSSIQGAFKSLTGSANSGVDEAKDKASSAVEDVKSNLPGQ